MADVNDAGGRRTNRWRSAAWSTAAALLLLPLLAMQVTDQVAWGPEDFVFAVVLIGGVGLAFELAARKSRNLAYRSAVAVALAAAFLLVWINAAVGIIESEDNPANLMFGAVLAVGLVGAVIAGFQPDGMARAMVATALAQALVAAIVLVTGTSVTAPVVPLTLFFAALWLLSAWLFRKAAREQRPASAVP